MKNKKTSYYICIPILVVVIIVSALLITVLIPNNNSKLYASELTGKKILVPQAAFGFSEAADEETYTVRFYVLGTEENVVEALRLIEQQTSNETGGYVIDQWASNNHGFYHDVYISYTV